MDTGSDEKQRINKAEEAVIQTLTANTPSSGIELAGQGEVEGELGSYILQMSDALTEGRNEEFVAILKTSVGVAMAGDKTQTIKFLTTGTSSQGIEYYSDSRETLGELPAYFQELAEAINANDADEVAHRIATILGVSLSGGRLEVVRYLTKDTHSQGIEAAPVSEIASEIPNYLDAMIQSLDERSGENFAEAFKTFVGVAISAQIERDETLSSLF